MVAGLARAQAQALNWMGATRSLSRSYGCWWRPTTLSGHPFVYSLLLKFFFLLYFFLFFFYLRLAVTWSVGACGRARQAAPACVCSKHRGGPGPGHV